MPKRINVDDSQRAPVQIGLNGENAAREIAYDITPWSDLSGAASVLVKRAGDTDPYISAATVDGNSAVWTVSDADLVDGYGEVQFVFTSGETIIAKSPVFVTFVAESLSGDAVDPPDPIKSWYDDVIAAAGTVEDAANRAETAAQQAEAAAGSIGDAVERAEAAADKAETSAANIGTAVEDAQSAADRAEAAVSGIEANAAAAAAAAAEAAEGATTASASAASASSDKVAAETAAQNAQQSAQTASDSVASIGDSVERAESAASWAESASGTAQTAASTATEKAEAASGYLDTVQADSQAAQQAATNAATSEAAAAQNAQTAQTAATSTAGSVEAAAASAAAAATSAEQAAQSAASIGNSVELAQAAASTAATKASEAAQSAEAAQESADDIKELVPIPTLDDNGKVMTVVDGRWAARDPGYPIETWEDVQKIVRMGAAPRYFPVGYEFVTHDNTENTDIVWRVVGFDTVKAADESLTYTMILETKYVYCNSSGAGVKMQTDATEVFYYAQNGLEAGTYHFTLPSGYDEDYGGGKTYFFTLANPVPVGGVLMFVWVNRTPVTDNFVYSYSAKESTDYLEKAGLTEGNDGTDLGTADGSTPDMNYIQRARFGSNNYAQSAIRQWLNSAQPTGSVWTPQTKFDKAPSWASNRAGFMAGLPEEFLSVICPASIRCRTNDIYEVDSLDETEFMASQNYSVKDKFFILSQPEIYGSWDSLELKDGEQLEFYADLSNAERIKYDLVGTEQVRLFRTPNAKNTNQFRSILTDTGNISSANPSINYALSIACIIA